MVVTKRALLKDKACLTPQVIIKSKLLHRDNKHLCLSQFEPALLAGSFVYELNITLPLFDQVQIGDKDLQSVLPTNLQIQFPLRVS